MNRARGRIGSFALPALVGLLAACKPALPAGGVYASVEPYPGSDLLLAYQIRYFLHVQPPYFVDGHWYVASIAGQIGQCESLDGGDCAFLCIHPICDLDALGTSLNQYGDSGLAFELIDRDGDGVPECLVEPVETFGVPTPHDRPCDMIRIDAPYPPYP